MPTEGVTKFAAAHRPGPLVPFAQECAAELLAWRAVVAALGGIGQDPARYDGAGFGNVSVRIPPHGAPRGARRFVITGTQTGGARCLSRDDLCVVERYRIKDNAVDSVGPAAPSSESMTHGAVYDLSPAIRAVVHIHCPLVFEARQALRLPCTQADVDYGTPAMAGEVSRLFRAGADQRQVFAMTAHRDGIVSFGRTLEEATQVLVSLLARAHAMSDSDMVCAPRAALPLVDLRH